MAIRGLPYQDERDGFVVRSSAFVRMLLLVLLWTVVSFVILGLLVGVIDLVWGADFTEIGRQLFGL